MELLGETIQDTAGRMRRLSGILKGRMDLESSKRPRGHLWQRSKREVEDHARRSAVDLQRLLVLEGCAKNEAAARIGIHPRTLSRWEEQSESRRETWRPMGRQLKRSPREVRNRVVYAAEFFGPGVSLRTVRAFLDDLPRSEVEEILLRYRRVYSIRHPVLVHELTWKRPGAVWAMDHAVPPEPVDGVCPAAFALRDLSSGFQLQWRAVEGMEVGPVITCLKESFETLGAPLVLKSDNGSAFISGAMEDFLRSWGVRQLLSPPRRPQYNGAVEASNRWLKAGTEREAFQVGRLGSWTSEDMDKAKDSANNARRRRGGVARNVWLARDRVTPESRSAFAATVGAEEIAALQERGLERAQELTTRQRRAVHRDSIRRALVAHGILCFKRRSIPLPIKSMIVDKAS
jgi:transposase InsO family protein